MKMLVGFFCRLTAAKVGNSLFLTIIIVKILTIINYYDSI